MGRQPCCDKVGLKRGPWTIDEDQKLINFILNNGIQCWHLVPKLAGLLRCGKSCRLRWTNYLRPDLKRGAFSEAEEDQIIQLHSRLGNRWSKIASHFPGRTDNEIKNHWNTQIKKRLKLLGLDPVTHKPIKQPADQKSHDPGSNITGDDEEDKVMEVAETSQDDPDSGLLSEAEKGNIGSLEAILDVEEIKLPLDVNSSSSTSTSTSSTSFSFSLDDSAHLKPSVNADSSNIEGSNLCWGENIDSFPSWETLYYLEDVLSFINYP